ncbi:MAG TPA: Smr/MutS family protein [Alphaproteobacteria bacterium]|nr:Smr/MutS family protein [Alphaproteobacteria bacterium]
MARNRKPSPDELKLWRLAMRDVAPLQPRAEEPGAPPVPEAVPPPARAKPGRPAAAPLPVAAPKLPPIVPGTSPGVDRRTADRLRRGQLPIDGRLDLHGMTQAQALDALRSFVLHAHGSGRRTLLIITGKGTYGEGGGVLRAALPRWLNDAPLRDKILTIAPAQPKHGGGGAMYVLLKRVRG